MVEDNGVGRAEAEKLKMKLHKSHGTSVTKQRLEIINNTNNVSVDTLDLTDGLGKPVGTRVHILIEI